MLARISAVFVASMLLATPPVAAQDSVDALLPPANFQGAYNETTQEVHLSWQALTENASYAYTVYRNGQMLDTTHATNYTDQLNLSLANIGLTTYHVTATPVEGENAGQESAPSSPLLAWNGPLDGPCNPLFITIYIGPPFVAYTIRWECIPQPFVGRPLVLLEPGDFIKTGGW